MDADEGRLHAVHQLRPASELPELLALGLRPRPEVHDPVAHEEEGGRSDGDGRGEERAVVHLEREVVEAERQAVGLVALGIQGQVHEPVDEAHVFPPREQPARAAVLQGEQPLLDPSPRLGGGEDLGAGLEPFGRRRVGLQQWTLHLEHALVGGEALADEVALLFARRRRRERPQLEVGGRVAGPPGRLEAVEQLARGRGGGGVGGRDARGEQTDPEERRTERGLQALHARARFAGVAGGLRGNRTANTLPCPGRLRTSTEPLCRRTISRTR